VDWMNRGRLSSLTCGRGKFSAAAIWKPTQPRRNNSLISNPANRRLQPTAADAIMIRRG